MQNWQSFFENAHLTPVKVLRQCWRRDSFSYLEKPRPDFGLMLLRSGEIDFICGTQKLCVEAGDVIFLPKGCFYKAVFHTERGNVENDLVNFDAETDACFVSPMRLVSSAPPACAAQFAKMTEMLNLKRMSMPEHKSALYALVASVLEAAEIAQSAHVSVVKKAQAILQENENISVREVARLCCISESGLRRLFADTLGISPVQYRTQMKIQKAKYLLQSTDLTVREIAEVLQFSTEAYFCKCFRAQTGMTPKQYIKGKRL